MLCLSMEAKPTNRLSNVVSYAWETSSCGFASILVFGAFIMVAYWSLTGTSLIVDLDSQSISNEPQFLLRLVERFSFCIGVAVFLTTYALNSVWWGCAPSAAFLLSMLGTGNGTLITLLLIPIIIGGLAGYYFNVFVQKKTESRLVYTGFRTLALLMCGLIVLVFASVNDIPFWLLATVWILKCSIMLSGAIQSIWRRCPVAGIAT